MMQFKGFKPEAMKKIQGTLGFQGYAEDFDKYLEDNPDKKATMDSYNKKAIEMMQGGYVKGYAEGGAVKYTGPQIPSRGGPNPDQIPGMGLDNFGLSGVDPRTIQQQDPRAVNTQTNTPTATTIGQSITDRAFNPQLPQGAVVQPVGTNVTTGQLIDPRQGQVAGDIVTPISSAATGTAQLPTATATNQVTADTAAAGVGGVLDQNTAAQGQIADESQVQGQLAAASSVSNLNAAQGTGILMSNPTQRKLETGELISGVANAETASNYAEKIQAAEATPTKEATIQGQLEGLMQAFEGGNTPAWAAGALRNASAEMAARGLGASSMAGQAMVQAAMESALPIAQADASVIANFEAQNLSNRQQRAMLAAEQRATFMGMEFDQAFQSRVMNASKVSDIANMNFTAEQQVALENSRIANTVNLSNLNNKQAMVMAEASALANIDMSNLSNRQQAAVQNAQAFLQMDMANLSNRQQTDTFNAQQRIQSLFTDQAAVNAARQFNASSANQTDQFFANLRNTTSQFNASQVNAQEQFNSGEANAMNKFTADIMNQRDQFNAQNRLIIDQSNAQWRREVATADTVAVNRANELNANSILEMSNTAYNDLWQYYADSMEWAWTSADNTMERMNSLAISELSADAQLAAANAQATSAAGSAIGSLIGTLGSAYISGMFGLKGVKVG